MTPIRPPDRTMLLPQWGIWILVWLLTALVIFSLGPTPAIPTVYPDELCRLGWARLLSGTGPHFNMGQATYCQPLYPLLLAPLHWIFSDPADIYRGIFAINCLLIAACLPLAAHLANRHFDLPPLPSILAGLLVVAYPSATLLSHHAWAEPALYPAILLTFIAFANWVDRPEWHRLVVLALASLALFALHRKMVAAPLILVAGLVSGIAFNRSSTYRKRALLIILGICAVLYGLYLIRVLVMGIYWASGDVHTVEGLVRLSDLRRIGTNITLLAGQMVYGSLITGGLVLLVLAYLAQFWSRRVLAEESIPAKFEIKALFPIVLLVAIMGTGVAFLGPSPRFDAWFYGRHVDPVLATCLIPAIALIVHGKFRVHSEITLVGITALFLWILKIGLPEPDWADFSPIHVHGVAPFMDWLHARETRNSLWLGCALAFAIAALVGLSALPGNWRFLGLLPFIVTAVYMHATVQPFSGVPFETALPSEVRPLLDDQRDCQIVWDHRISGRLPNHQFYRIQYHFPKCKVTREPIDNCSEFGNKVIVTRTGFYCPSRPRGQEFFPQLMIYPPLQNAPRI